MSKKSDLKQKLRERISNKKLERTSQVVRDEMMDKLEEKLKKSSSASKKKEIREKIQLLEKIEEKQWQNSGDNFEPYVDNACYGGSLVHEG